MEYIFDAVSREVVKEFGDVRDEMMAGLKRMYENPLKLFPTAGTEETCRRILFVPTTEDIKLYVLSRSSSEIPRQAKVMSLLYTIHSKKDALFRTFIQTGGFASLVSFINDANPYLRAQAVEMLKNAVTRQKELKISRDALIEFILKSKIFEAICERIDAQFDGDGPFFGEAIVSLLFACMIYLRENFQVNLVLGRMLTRALKRLTDPKDPLMIEFGSTEFPGHPSDAVHAQIGNRRPVSCEEWLPDDADAWANAVRLIGNNLFKSGEYAAAKEVYEFILNHATEMTERTRGVLLWNRCLSNQKLGRMEDAVQDASAGSALNEKCSEFLDKFRFN